MTPPRDGDGETRWLAKPASAAQTELREALDQAAAREADEVALRRVWSRLADLPDLLPLSAADRVRVQAETARSSRARWPWIVAASLAGVTATLAFMLVESKSEVSGARKARMQIAQVPPAGAPAKRDSADQRSAFVAPAIVRTGLGETLKLSLRGGTDVVVESESVLVLDENDRPSISVGEVQFHVPPQAPGRTFAVEVGAYRVVVVGTRFHVRRDQTTAAVGVDEGVVEIWTDHRIARVAAGGSWVGPQAPTATVSGTVPGKVPAITGESADKIAAERSREPAAGGSTAVRNDNRLGDGSRAPRAPGAAAPFDSRARASMPARVPTARAQLALASPSTVPAAPTQLTGAIAAATQQPTNQPLNSDGLLPVVIDSPPPTVAPSGGDVPPLMMQARAARAAGDPRRALGLYRSLAQKGGAMGENAEYEIGRILRDGLHQPREAVLAWRSYRAQHPRGLLRIESDLSIIETLVTMDDKISAVAEASDFIRRYPESERRTEIARITGDLLREQGDCTSAVSAYDVALAGVRGRRDLARDAADAVAFHRSACLLRGDPADGTDALKTYLQSFPNGRFRSEALRLISGAAPIAPPPQP
ncbi:MAG: FecR family protein [Bacteroidota bacterium]